MTDHEKIKALISAYFDEEIAESEKSQVIDHMIACESCRKYYLELKTLSKTLKTWANEDLSLDMNRKSKRILRRNPCSHKREVYSYH